MFNKFRVKSVATGTALLLMISLNAAAAPIIFSGELDVVLADNGSAIYSNTPLGTTFSGQIDDATFFGNISNGSINTFFECCINAGGLEFENDRVFEQAEADLINDLLTINGFPQFAVLQAGTLVDGLDIEGDIATPNDGRLEVGLSYLFPADTIADENPSNYPFNPDDVALAVFFVLEEGGGAEYDALGVIRVGPAIAELTGVPLPAAAWLFPTGLIAGLGWMRRRNST